MKEDPFHRYNCFGSGHLKTDTIDQVADFGLARDLTECEYYRKTGDGKVDESDGDDDCDLVMMIVILLMIITKPMMLFFSCP